MLLTQQAGYLEAEEGERSARFTQSLICKNVDENTRRKQIDLKLTELGPYRRVLLLFRCRLRLHLLLLLLLHLLYARNRHSFSRNGRYMMLGGRLGHLSSMDWQVTLPPRCTRLLAAQQGCVCHVTRALRPAASNLKSTCGRLCGTSCTCTTTPWWLQHSASTRPPLPYLPLSFVHVAVCRMSSTRVWPTHVSADTFTSTTTLAPRCIPFLGTLLSHALAVCA